MANHASANRFLKSPEKDTIMATTEIVNHGDEKFVRLPRRIAQRTVPRRRNISCCIFLPQVFQAKVLGTASFRRAPSLSSQPVDSSAKLVRRRYLNTKSLSPLGQE